jgi:hypothetical protein
VTDELPFTFELLASAGDAKRPLTVCTEGHLVVASRTHWRPVRLSPDRRALICRNIGCTAGPHG